MDNLMIFEGHEVEILEVDGVVLFNAKHVAEILEIKNVNDNISRMNDKQVVKLTNSAIGKTDIRKFNNAGENFLTESGVYKLVFKSHKPNAEKFTDWIADEVLPTIRKTGAYIPEIPKDYPSALRALADECEKRMQVEQENQMLLEDNEKMRPKAEFFDELVDRNLLVNFRDAANTLGIKQREFIQFLKERKYIYHDAKGQIRPYADKNDGLFVLKPYNSRYSDHAGEQTLITPRGLETFRLLLKNIA